MKDDIEAAAVLVLYALAAISGGLGGCAVTAHQFVQAGGRGKVQMRLSWLLAYGIIGVMFGLLFAAYGLSYIEVHTATDIVGPALLAGFVGALALGAANTTARVILKRLGVEIEVSIRRRGDS